MIHVLAAHGAESGNDESDRASYLRGATARAGPGNGLGQLGARLRRAFDNVADRRALARCFINGGAGAACEPAHQKARRTVRIMHIAAARTAGASGLFVFLADVAIAAQAGALKPCCVVELTGLDVKTDGYQTGLADGIGRRAAAATSAEVTHDRLAFYDENPAAVAVMIPVAVPIAIVVLR